jgi:hypothetical protein
MATHITNQNDISELLYHVNRTIIDLARDKSGATQTTDVFSTFTRLAAAKAAARSVLPSEGYSKEDFTQYEENDGTKEWIYREGGMVFAKALSGEEFHVYLDTKPNLLRFMGNASGEVEGHLHYGKHCCCWNLARLIYLQSSKPRSTTTRIAQEASRQPKLKAHTVPARQHEKPQRKF